MRKAKTINIELSNTEINHILSVLLDRADEGSYSGDREKYYKRTEELIEKLGRSLKGEQ